MAAGRNAKQGAAVTGGGRLDPGFNRFGRLPRGRWRALSLRSRLFLLVVASVVPLIGMGLVREFLEFRSEQEGVYDGLLTVARATSVAVERELQIRVSALEVLGTSPALQAGDLDAFDRQADAFLKRQPPDTVLGLAGPGMQRLRMYGLPPDAKLPQPVRDVGFMGGDVFTTRTPFVTNMRAGHATGRIGFSVDVPVFHDGEVAYDLFLRLLPNAINALINQQHLPAGTVLTIVDAAGAVVARTPNEARFIGSPIVPGLWEAVKSHPEGVTRARTLEGVPAVATFTHVAPFGWAVIVGAREDVLFAPLWSAVWTVTVSGAIVLTAALLLAGFAARGITRPIEQLRRLAVQTGEWSPGSAISTGLPETDTVAEALRATAAERQAAARALAESESRFRALFERSPSGTILLDPDTTRVIDSNAVAAGYVGYTIDEFRGRPITDFALETSVERIQAICRSVVAGNTMSYEARVSGRLGPRDLLIAVAPVQVCGRTLVLLNQIDVTDLRRAEAGLRVNEERLELARQGANLGIWDWNVTHRTLSWSEQQWHLHGLPPAADGATEAIWRSAVHPDDLERVEQELLTALKHPDRLYATEYSVILPDGSVRRLLARGQTIRDAEGYVARMVGINMDVTDRFEAEMARDRLIQLLETERNRLSEIIEALPVGVGIIDATGRVVLGNAVMMRLNGPVIQSMTKAPRGTWIGYDQDGQQIRPEDFPIRRALRLGETTLPGVEFLFRDTDGAETWFRVASMPLRTEAGQVREALGIFQDIDAEKRLLDVQQQINARLEQRVREEMVAREAAQQRAAHAERMHALGQIAGGIAHDFNNVLQAVSGGAALIERRPQDLDRVLRNVRMILDASRRGASITSRLLAFSRRGDLRAEPVDAAALLSDMAEVLTHTLGGSVVCVVAVPPELPPLFADRGQLETVLVNLATNARDAMPSGGTLTMAADIEVVSPGLPHPSGLSPGGYVKIIVSDTGAGMDNHVLARVTEPFFTTKEPGKGTGLGLAMAKGFVEQSGGSLSIDSVVGRGTRITLWLPRADAAGGAPEQPTPADRFDPEKPSVLLVDDDAIVRDVLTLSLEDAGYAVHAADGGAAALARLTAGDKVDIIVSDLTMPGMDGLSLIRAAQQHRPNLPAVLLTGYAGDGATLAVGGAISGTFSLLRKPVSGTQLVDRINALLASRKQTSSV